MSPLPNPIHAWSRWRFLPLYTELISAETNFFQTPQLDFGILVQPALQDSQSRLVFRTENLIVKEIQNFAPKDRDLDYPRLLHVTSGRVPTSPSVNASGIQDTSATSEFFDSGVLFQGWYPPLRKSIWILSKIYRLVNVFPPCFVSWQ
jgi:conserved oligomeric Golgi complex subunit 3